MVFVPTRGVEEMWEDGGFWACYSMGENRHTPETEKGGAMDTQSPQVSAGEVLEELRAIALARATDFMGIRDGALDIRSTEEIPPGLEAAIASIEKTSTGLKIKFYDKLKALELMGKYLGLFEPKTARREPEENNLLDAILAGTKGEVDTHDIPELQQAAAACHDLVESPGAAGF